ncbi:MAG: MBL fold metallo-hydrolase [Candidatus Sericytochromatia bacterium]
MLTSGLKSGLKSGLIFALFALSGLLSGTRPANAATEVHRLDTGIANVYLLKGPKSFLIDSSSVGHEAEIEAWLKAHQTPVESLEAIILTHGHGDHAGGALKLGKTRGVPVWVGAGDQGMLNRGRSRDLIPTSFWAGVLRLFVDIPYTPFQADRLISEPVDLSPFGIQGRVLPLPGHTAGSLVVVLNEQKIALVGDLFRGGVFQNQTPRVHFFHEERPQTMWQIWQLLEKEGIQAFYPGHFGPLQAPDVKGVFFPSGHFNWGLKPQNWADQQPPIETAL